VYSTACGCGETKSSFAAVPAVTTYSYNTLEGLFVGTTVGAVERFIPPIMK